MKKKTIYSIEKFYTKKGILYQVTCLMCLKDFLKLKSDFNICEGCNFSIYCSLFNYGEPI